MNDECQTEWAVNRPPLFPFHAPSLFSFHSARRFSPHHLLVPVGSPLHFANFAQPLLLCIIPDLSPFSESFFLAAALRGCMVFT
jgi:hypothetical protein